MCNIFKTVATDIGLHTISQQNAKSASQKNLKTLSKKDMQRREALSKAIKVREINKKSDASNRREEGLHLFSTSLRFLLFSLFSLPLLTVS
jgi:hypothetical protein